MCTNGPGCIIDSESNASYIEIRSTKYYSDRFYLNEPNLTCSKGLEKPWIGNNTEARRIAEPWPTFDRNELIESLDLSCAIISTYSINWNWTEKEIPSLFGDGAKTPVLLLHHDRQTNTRYNIGDSRASSGTKKDGTGMKINHTKANEVPEEEGWDSENSTNPNLLKNVYTVKVHAKNKEPSPVHCGVHHPKYMLLFEKKGSVVVLISTCNLAKPTSFEGFWMQRFPPSRRSLNYREGMNDFGWILGDFLQVQTDFATNQQKTKMLPFPFLERYVGVSSASELASAFQFDKANVFLVSTVPGNHVGLQSWKSHSMHDVSRLHEPPLYYGPQRVSYISQTFLSTPSTKLNSKLCPREAKKRKIQQRKLYMPSFLLSPKDKIMIQGTTYGHSWNQSNMLPVLQSYLGNDNSSNTPRSLENLSIIWPSMSYIQSCKQALNNNGIFAFLTSENFNTIDLAILSQMVLYRPLPLFAWQIKNNQDISIAPHIKSVSRVIQKDIISPLNSNHTLDTTFLSYFLLTSSNFSQGAQGKLISDIDDTMSHANFELGVLFSSRVQGNPFQDRIYASTSIHNLQNTTKCLHCHSYCKILQQNKKVKVIYLPIPFQLHNNYTNNNNYMKEENDTDMIHTPYFSKIQDGTPGIGNMRLTPFGKEWISNHYGGVDGI